MERILRVLLLIFCAAGVFALAVTGTRNASAAADAVLYIDGQAVSGNAAVSAGTHTITAQSNAQNVCITAYENGRFVTASFEKTLSYTFPDSGAEIALCEFDSDFRPVAKPVRVTQTAAARKLAYSGSSLCYDEFHDEGDGDFYDYTISLRVITENGKIIDVRDIVGTNYTDWVKTASEAIVPLILDAQSADVADTVTGATCSYHAIQRAVRNALQSEPEPYTDPDEPEPVNVPDGVYFGSAQCLTGYINYMVDVDVTVKDNAITEISDRTLKTPMSSNDKALYNAAWRQLSAAYAKGVAASDADNVDTVTGATVSSSGIKGAVRDALERQTQARTETGTQYAPEGISLYARVYPVVTVRDGKITAIRIVPARNTDTDALEAFAAEIVRRQSLTGLTWTDEDAFAVANLTDQILYGKGVLQ